ncbi:MBOAT family O-acyltransferase [Oleisolibacter albus]|uniref:MBOAT family O-acyltransferase n=1 Tax=Oleisolibacter albus TaxID=2171757 RepID=UPI000DF3BB43|nr:MBOAT family O-acyltransferase [Oleisolibacter albus]
MLFHTWPFAVFLALYLTVHLAVPAGWRLGVMIVGSAVFYGYWNWAYAPLPLLLCGATHLLTLWVAAAPDARWRLRLGVVLLLLPLIFFKYTHFLLTGLLAPLLRGLGLTPPATDVSILLPLGISFITFTLIAYLVDVARRRSPAAPLSRLAGYVLFFPHLIAGPILRPHELIPQLGQGLAVTAAALRPAVLVFCLGLVKKVVIADNLALLVNPVYADPASATAASSLLAYYAFAGQIYCDFSGYTDMAIGLALLFGVRLPVNFNHPYAAQSVGDFWRRWHITLSHWFRDYVFFPLGSRRASPLTLARNIVITMTLSGLWHGAGWTFLLFGLVNGLATLPEIWTKRRHPARGWRRAIRIVLTFHLLLLTFILFRAPDLDTAVGLFRALLGGNGWGDLPSLVAHMPFECLLVPFYLAAHAWDDHRRLAGWARGAGGPVVIALAALAVLLAASLGPETTAQFIYFDF